MASPSDPRFLRSREMILKAAREILVDQGPTAVTHARIAEHAGIARATIYRHWPKPEQLLAEAMATVPLPFFATPSAPIRTWLVGELSAIAAELGERSILAVGTTLASNSLWDPDVDAQRDHFARLIRDRVHAALEEAVASGEVTLKVDAASAAALVLGPIYYRATIEHEGADAELIATIVSTLGSWSKVDSPRLSSAAAL